MKIIAVLIALNAENSLRKFYQDFPKNMVDKIILVDDNSSDKTYELALKLGIEAYKNKTRLGYGGNMKKALLLALKMGAEVIVDLHPDGEYKADCIPRALEKIKEGNQLVLGNRFFKLGQPLKSGMYYWKFLPIVSLNWIGRVILRRNITDFHQGFRVYTKELLNSINFKANSDNYLFSFELIAQAVSKNMKIAQVSVSTSYTGKKRGASLKSSLNYSLGTFWVLGQFLLSKIGIKTVIFQ